MECGAPRKRRLKVLHTKRSGGICQQNGTADTHCYNHAHDVFTFVNVPVESFWALFCHGWTTDGDDRVAKTLTICFAERPRTDEWFWRFQHRKGRGGRRRRRELYMLGRDGRRRNCNAARLNMLERVLGLFMSGVVLNDIYMYIFCTRLCINYFICEQRLVAVGCTSLGRRRVFVSRCRVV